MATSELVVKFKKLLLINDEVSVILLLNNISTDEADNFYNALKKEGLDLLFYSIFKKNIEKLIKYINLKIENEYRIETLNQMFIIKDIDNMITGLENNYIYLKGIYLKDVIELNVYKRIRDIDIIVDKRKIKSIMKYFENFGYKKKKQYYGEHLLQKENGIPIDVHYSLSVSWITDSYIKINFDKLIQNSILYNIGSNIKVNVLNLETMLMHLCIHFTINHKASSFMCIYELNKFIAINYEKLNKERLKIIALETNSIDIIVYTMIVIYELTLNEYCNNIIAILNKKNYHDEKMLKILETNNVFNNFNKLNQFEISKIFQPKTIKSKLISTKIFVNYQIQKLLSKHEIQS